MEHLSADQYKAMQKPNKSRWQVANIAARTDADGTRFDSKREMLRWQKLVEQEKHGLIRDLKRQVTYAVEINGEPYTRFTPDAEYVTAQGETVYIDVKSTGTQKDPAYRLRKKAFELFYHVKITEVLK